MATTSHDDLIGSVEAGSILGKSPRTVHRLVESGVLTPAMKARGGFAGIYLFRRSDVEALAAERLAATA